LVETLDYKLEGDVSLTAKVVDIIFGTGLFINAMLFVPQAIRISTKKHAGDISLITFIGFLITQLSAVVYGYLHNDYILVVGYALSFITCGGVTVLALKYRRASCE
jgi:uncharacterized protein with PQ loop repeat